MNRHFTDLEDPPISDRWVFFALIGLLAWAPLPLGSNRILPVVVLVSAALLIFGSSLWSWRKNKISKRLLIFWPPITLLFLITTLNWLQIIPIPNEWLAFISPEAHAVWGSIGKIGHLSVEPGQTAVYAALSTIYFTTFITVLLTIRNRQRLEALVTWMVYICATYAVIGIILFSFKTHYFAYYSEIIHDRVKGPFRYHNSMAGFLVLGLSIGIGLMLAKLGNTQKKDRQWKEKIIASLKFILSSTMILRLVLVIMVIALVLTRSRMGNTAFFAGLLITGATTLLLTKRSAPAMVGLIISLLIVDIVIIGTWVGLERVVQRIEETSINKDGEGREESIEQRQEAAKEAIEIIKDFPVFGSGGGTFYNSYIRYRTLNSGYYDHAHNDYIEIAADFGIYGITLFSVLIAASIYISTINIYRRRSPLPRGISFGALMAIIGMGIHSAVDFNMQIPSNALWMTTIIAIGWTAYRIPSNSRSPD